MFSSSLLNLKIQAKLDSLSLPYVNLVLSYHQFNINFYNTVNQHLTSIKINNLIKLG
jgi:hypothetical protein